MKRIRWTFVTLIVCFSLFFALGRVTLGAINIIDIHGFVYVLTVVAVTVVILVPRLAQASPLTLLSFWLGIFVLLELFLFDPRPLWGGVYTYLSLTEVAGFLLLVFLGRHAGLQLQRLDEAVRYVSLAQKGQNLLKVEDAGRKIRREMTRSRHFHRALSVVLVEPHNRLDEVAVPEIVAEIQREVAGNYAAARVADVIGSQIRVVDTVLEDGDGTRFVILCPEIGQRGSNLLAERISQSVREAVNIEVTYGVSTFPEEALTFESLVARAGEQLDRRRASGKERQSSVPVQPEVLKAEM